MAIHIGKIIQDKLREKNMDVTVFVKRMNYTRSNAYKIFSKSSIDTDVLMKVNAALGENLFLYYITEQEIAQGKDSKLKPADISSTLNEIKSLVVALDKKLDGKQEAKTTTKTAGLRTKAKTKK